MEYTGVSDKEAHVSTILNLSHMDFNIGCYIHPMGITGEYFNE